jgi:hypothetical protein
LVVALVTGGRARFYTRRCSGKPPSASPVPAWALYRHKGHAGVITHKPAIREIVAFLRADQRTQDS